MKKTKLFALSLTLAGLTLGGCSLFSKKEDEQPKEEEPATVVPVVDKYTKETTTYADKPLATTTKVRFHYHRKGDDGSLSDYVKWTIWIWDTANGGNGARYEFATYDDFGVICDVDLSVASAAGHTTTSQLGFIISTVNWTKDIDEDRYIDIKEQSPGGCQEVSASRQRVQRRLKGSSAQRACWAEPLLSFYSLFQFSLLLMVFTSFNDF